MKPGDFRRWAEQVFTQSPAVASVTTVRDVAEVDVSRIELATGAAIHMHWVGTSPPKPEDPENPVTGPPPAPVKIPELSTSGRLRMADIEAHLAALLTNAGNDQVLDVAGYSADPKLGSDEQPYGLRVRFHDESAAFGLFRHTLPKGQQAGRNTEFKQRREV